MMKKIVLSVGGLILSASSFACSYSLSADPVSMDLIRRSPAEFDIGENCQLLNRKGLVALVESNSTVRENLIISYARVSLLDERTRVTSVISSVTLGSDACLLNRTCLPMHVEKMGAESQSKSIRDALANFNFVAASNEIDAIKAQTKMKK